MRVRLHLGRHRALRPVRPRGPRLGLPPGAL
jgi:hypothetical protein